jgi:TetR/AcrR family transcriptional regulator, fatty acid metabolism regulator protein
MRTADPARGELILEAAARLFHKRHYHEVRMDDVAADAGVAKGTIYRYFRDKEDLYLALILASLNRFIADITPMMADPEPADRRLRAYVRRSLAFCERYPYFMDLVQRVEGTTSPERLAPLQEGRQRILRIVADVIADLNHCERFHVPDPQIAAIAFVGMLRQTLRFLPKPWPEDLPDRIADQFLYGVCPLEKRAANVGRLQRRELVP